MENHDDLPLVSVGIPTYNHPEGLRRTLECITQQTYSNLEIIVSDNCSPGRETEVVVREFMDRDLRIQYFRQEENIGPTLNFQFVLETATGEYFMWAADDDAWEPSYVSCMVEALENNPDAVLSFCRFDFISVDKQPLTPINRSSRIIGQDRLYRLLYSCCLMPYVANANYIYGLIRKDILLKCGGVETRVDAYRGADIVTLFHLLYYGKFITVDKLLHHYTLRCQLTESLSQRFARQSLYFLVKNYLKWLMGWHQHHHILRVIIKETPLKSPQKIILLTMLYMKELLFYFDNLTRTFIRYVLNRPHII